MYRTVHQASTLRVNDCLGSLLRPANWVVRFEDTTLDFEPGGGGGEWHE